MSLVRWFHMAFGQAAPADPIIPDVATAALRARLVREEFDEVNNDFSELLAALRRDAPASEVVPIMQALNKELCDLRYVVEGSQLSWGSDPDELFRRVHLSNMSKLDSDGNPLYDAGGKVVKGPHYTPVDPADMFPSVTDCDYEEVS